MLQKKINITMNMVPEMYTVLTEVQLCPHSHWTTSVAPSSLT